MTRLTLALMIATVFQHASAADWPQFLGPNRDGIVTGQQLPDKFPPGGPRQAWSIPTGAGFGGASIAGGRVYILDREEAARDTLRCIGLIDGKEIWRQSYAVPGSFSFPGSRSTPTVDDKYIFTVGGFGQVSCFDRQTGGPVWSFKLQDKFKSPVPNWGFAQSPLIYKDWVIIAPMSAEAGLAALKKETGEVVWKSPSIGGDTYTSPRLYKLGGVEQLVLITRTGVYGIAPETGKKLWQFEGYKNNIPIPSPTQVDDNRLFVTGGYGAGSVMIKLDHNGETFSVSELWRTRDGSQIHPAMLVGGHLYLNGNTNETLKSHGKNAPGLICFDLDGKVKWQSHNQPSIDRGGMIVADGRAYLLAGQTGMVHLIELNPEKYTELDSAKPLTPGKGNENIWGPMSMSDGLLIVRDQHSMKCLDLKPVRQARAD